MVNMLISFMFMQIWAKM